MRGADLHGLLRVLVAEHAVEELPHRLRPGPTPDHDVVLLQRQGRPLRGCYHRCASGIVWARRANSGALAGREACNDSGSRGRGRARHGWFAIGSIWNVRQGNAAMRWMQGGLPAGRRANHRPLDRHDLGRARHRESVTALRAASSSSCSSSRGTCPGCGRFSRQRGRRDTLIVVARLGREPPPGPRAARPGELVGPRCTAPHEVRAVVGARTRSTRSNSRSITSTTPRCPVAMNSSTSFKGTGVTVRRLSVRRGEPHLQLHVDLPTPSTPAAEFFARLRAVAERASAPLNAGRGCLGHRRFRRR